MAMISDRLVRGLFLSLCSTLIAPAAFADAPNKAPNFGTVANTRHNMTQSYLGVGANWMDMSRNDYGEVCVYCHTPHGANGAIPQAPLWNRTQVPTAYQTYSSSTLSQPITQPGPNSLTCLSCHDGQTAIDSIINMPGSGRYNSGQQTAQNLAFLNSWPGGPGGSLFGGHGTLSTAPAVLNDYGQCQSCHSVNGDQHNPGVTAEFDVFYIATDLRNDHPVGVTYPAANPDFQAGTVVSGNLRFFDTSGNGRPDKNEIRFYDTGDGYEVECASCHDPHGVPSGGPASPFLPAFLRVSNASSALCLSCHNK